MRAAVFNGVGRPFDIEDRPDPTPNAGEIIVKVERCGVCGSDLHMTSGHGGMTYQPGSVIGHEYAGEIVALGAEVEGFKVGQRVTSIPLAGCGRCEACVAGHPALCPQMKGYSGGYAEYVRCAASGTILLPQTLSMEDGALCEPLAVGLHGVAMAQMPPGSRVAVLGAGSVALAAIFWARKLGAGRIVAVSRSDRRAAMALEMGASAFVQSGEGEIERVTEALGGQPDIVLECVGVPGMLDLGVKMARRNGKVVSLGFCTAPDPINPAMATFKQVSLHFSMHFTLREFQHVADTLDAGHVEPRSMITTRVGLDELPAAIERLRGANEDTKVHVAPGQ
ncbi:MULTISPECIES: zinc-dependent alcohol dehydrogenase [unclassified Sphingobium]|uniref:zinc-dependent alcohol dehydrogenase n=1 Tax=unclassified Sphingobium TaxID=2611147 RepID=UPI000D1729E4|nr:MULTISPECIES: alcohol dehydrogenase catalytic domain-containing protein [unclassified Sphingobium]MBG6120024.1 threonine dehydrogenase-like Zn-dependent dehydrogenase [Sphingobium sp. JAI105]PSO12919.1 alcohol dehydrogenase [Sphingobium sp. AEW4]TWD05775.1 threonine dehydrogenase-like Zn-dependent dehydrogenase [Sphingobium sp. AEW010]TWD23328.1 threonine dehydrogenase-like Zn-dependent dehydrogenase [Sphingobium sp. AEW013]TWD25188.1 threonine dehydrogenase-like Zn-dependent dehydrogenase 